MFLQPFSESVHSGLQPATFLCGLLNFLLDHGNVGAEPAPFGVKKHTACFMIWEQARL
jgi:hypothetical protein